MPGGRSVAPRAGGGYARTRHGLRRGPPCSPDAARHRYFPFSTRSIAAERGPRCPIRQESPVRPPARRRRQPPVATDTTVVRAAIHPAIGIARVGNSRAGTSSARRSSSRAGGPGLLSRRGRGPEAQAARFRVYGYNAAGAGRPRAHRRRGAHPLDRARREPEGGLVSVADGPRHPRGGRRPGAAAERGRQGRGPAGAGHRRRPAVDRGTGHPGLRIRVPSGSSRGPTSTWARSGPTPTGGSSSWAAAASRPRRTGARSTTRSGPERVHQRRRLVRRHVRRPGHGRGDHRRAGRSRSSRRGWSPRRRTTGRC